jgi:phosphatidylserine/phosphatidylglycerophosphate/cardiolipin synthase-like enzyme
MATNDSVLSINGDLFLFQSKRADWNPNLISVLAKFIMETKNSLSCAIYDLRDDTILNALKDLKERNGIKLSIAYDAGKARSGGVLADPKPSGNETKLKEFKLDDVATAVHAGGHIMHDKFIIRDSSSVWTGSANFTKGGLELQDNNCVVLHSKELASAYQNTFNELLNPRHKHPRKEVHDASESKTIKVGSINVTPYFSPSSGEGIEEKVLSVLNDAKDVRICSMIISDPDILQAIYGMGNNNSKFNIRGIYDLDQMKKIRKESRQDPDLFWFMDDKRFMGAPTHPFSPDHENDFMHNKVVIVNDKFVLTGSYNLSENAEGNDENLLVIESSRVAAAYSKYFDALYEKYKQMQS